MELILNNIYITSIWITIGMSFIFCLFFSILSVPPNANLHNYGIARYVMACAYLSLGLMNIIELFTHSEVMNIQSAKMIALLVCLFQSFLFTYTNITLINFHFATKRNIFLESIPIILFCVLTPIVLSIHSSPIYTDILFFIFIVYYVFVLIRYTILFQRNYNQYIREMDNFYADQEAVRFRWIYVSFYAALAIGIMALYTTLFFSPITGIVFSLFIIGFYSYYGIQFINYAHIFQNIEVIIMENTETENNISSIRNYTSLKISAEQWVADKKFLEPGVNIENVAMQLDTNRTYLSEYVNIHLQITFKEWISELRIGEAKTLLLKHPDLSVSEISERAGFSDKSNFGRLFTKSEGISPNTWRKSKEGQPVNL